MPGSFANEALQAQAIAARSYALYAVRTRGQRSGRSSWDGCDCPLYATVCDQHYAGYAKEQGYYGGRWVAAVRDTGSLMVRYGSRLVQAFYLSSSGGHTSSNAQWGATPCPGSRAAPTPMTGAAAPTGTRTPAGPRRCRRPPWAPALASAPPPPSARPSGPPGAGGSPASPSSASKDGRRTSATISGAWLRKAYALKSTKFHISP